MNRPAPEALEMQPSVVVASRQHRSELARCLGALLPQCRTLGAELIVARDPAAGPLGDTLEREGPIRLVQGPAGVSIPVLRGLGMQAATGDPVALTEDHLVPADTWLVQLLGAMEQGGDVVGGGMANAARGRAIDWAAYFSDYGFYSFARPPAKGRPLITAANIAYRRRVVPDVARWAGEGAWENVVHDRLRAAGTQLRFVPAARVYHDHRYRLLAFGRNRFRHGLDYARSRLAESPGTSAWRRLVTTPLLPPVLFARIARAAWREAPLAFWGSAPLTCAFLTAWALGEAWGYVRGPERVLR